MGILLLQILIVVSAIIAIAVWRLPLRVWMPGFGVLLIILSTNLTPPWSFLVICWLLYLATAVYIAMPSFRHEAITRPILARLRKILPPMSETERIALEAGDVWWEAELFRGRPDWQKFSKISLQTLSPEEQSFIDNQVEKLCSMLNDYEIVKNKNLPEEVWNYLKQQRFFGMVISKEYGGLGFSALAHSTVVMKIASRSVSAAVNMMVPNSLGPAELLTHYGTVEQKQYYLPRLATGEEIPCFALTSAEAGSDAGAIQDRGIVCKQKMNDQEVLGIRLTFNKRYITLAPIATVIGIAFKLYDPDHLLSTEEDRGITACLIPADHPGVKTGARHSPLGLAIMNGPVAGTDVFIPLDWVIGGPEMVGQGWRMLMECLSIGRSISLPALSTAMTSLSYRTTGAYATIRKQFKLSIGQFEGVEEALAPIAGYAYLLEATRRFTATAVDAKVKPSLASAIAKYHMTELARKVLDHAMDIHAGRGIQLGPRNYLGLSYQSMPMSITVEGANILTRNLIIFGQGALRCHPFVRDEMAAAADPDEAQGFIKFDQILLKHIGYTASNFITALGMGLGLGFMIKVPAGEVSYYYRQITRMSAALALASDCAMLMLGGALKRNERLSARLGDVLSQLYLASSVLKYFEDQKRPSEDWPSVQWTLQMCLFQAQIAFEDFFSNFSQRGIGRILRAVVFPLGRSYKKPSDKLDQILARQICKPSSFRDRLTEYCYQGSAIEDPVGRIERTFAAVILAEPLERKLRQGESLTAAETELCQQAEQLRQDAIMVDVFK